MKLFLVLLIAVTVSVGWTVPTAVIGEPMEFPKHDPRVGALHAFLSRYNEDPHYEKEYLKATDSNNLDWRLLPAISVIESQAGRHYRFCNYWGWNSAKTGFASVPEGIRFVTGQLATSRYYAGKTTSQILTAYGPGTTEYVNAVMGLIQKLDSLNH